MLRQIERPEVVDTSKVYRLLGVRWYGQGLFVREEKIGADIAANRVYSIKPGDFIYNRLFAWKGSFAVADAESCEAHVSSEFPCFVPEAARLDPYFLLWYFRQKNIWAEVLGLSSGATPTSRNRLKESVFFRMEVPLPPLAEQRRLVTRIEELSVRVRQADNLHRQAVGGAEALSQAGSEASYRQLREHVGCRRLAEVCETITDGDHNTPPFTDDGIRFISVGNVSTGHLHFDNSKRVDERYFKALSTVRVPRRGDILYSAVGATLGIPVVVDTDEPFCFQRHVAILKPNRSLVDSTFVWHMLRSRTVFDRAWASTTGSAQPTIPLHAIRGLPVPVQALAEQRRVASELEALRAEVDGLKRLHAETAAELDALVPAVLDCAFRGEL